MWLIFAGAPGSWTELMLSEFHVKKVYSIDRAPLGPNVTRRFAYERGRRLVHVQADASMNFNL